MSSIFFSFISTMCNSIITISTIFGNRNSISFINTIRLLFFLSEQCDLAGIRHTGECTQFLQSFDMGLGQFVAAQGELLHGDEVLALSLFHSVQRRRLAQTVYRSERRQQAVGASGRVRAVSGSRGSKT